MVSVPVFADINWVGAMGSFIYYLGYALLGLATIAIMWMVFTVSQYTIKAEVFPMYGSGKKGIYSFSKPKNNRVRWIKKRTAWKPLFPLGNKKEIEPFSQEYVYPGKQIKVFDYNGEWIPARVNIHQDDTTLSAEIAPVPYYVRNWQSLQHKKHAAEFAEHNFWEDNKYFIMGVVAVLICCILCGATIYFTYKFAGAGTGAMNNLASAIKDMNVIPGIVK